MRTITLSGKTYDLQTVTGKLLDTNKNLETKVSGSGGGGFNYRGTGGNSNVRIKSTTTVHDQLFIEDSEGREHSFQLQDFDLACREGNILSVIAAIKQGKKDGPYIAVINHTTEKTYFSKEALKEVGGPNKLMLAGIFIALAVIGFAIGGGGFFIGAVILFAVIFGYYVYAHNKDIKELKTSIHSADFKPHAVNSHQTI